MASGTGLRERKRALTRRALNQEAVRLFLERGFDNVTVAEIADGANVALTTLFTYYPEGKVALVFEQDEDRAEALTRAIRDRDAGVDVLSAVEAFMADRLPFGTDDPDAVRLLHLIFSTPQLRAYVRTKWTDCEDVLTDLLAEERPQDNGITLRALARFILESPDIAARAEAPADALRTIVAGLRRGWGRE
ncbi:TetR/AcrR family transcriptional regulator [Microbacterium sp. 13-71-7]|jgi:AcrR family transcriptional regulator|uniref:TetR/AcrR family transcriptional regulator n=1 Tax=Microbacterium sp. 13-71-7 TaxID=1970399 RepID=UPI000BD83A28|nr:TetR/AcrR family transcriptional regulator [Microbacterium sp. 13-71-7]OZB83072.1 MAG: TetR family transcriptional regulator [Microbacterium sp. 13-71-7]